MALGGCANSAEARALKVTFKLQAEAVPIFRQMAKEAGLSVNDMGEIAVYALIGSYVRDKAGKADPTQDKAGSDVTVVRPPEHVITLPTR